MAELEKVMEVAEELTKQEAHEPQLKGAFASVMILGIFILICWLFVFILFMIRNGG